MLALGMEHGHGVRRGVGGEGRGTTAGKGTASAGSPWHPPASGRPLPRGAALNIRQKISQWEGLSQAEESQAVGVKGRGRGEGSAVVLRRGHSGDALGNGFNDGNNHQAGDSPRGKASLAKAKSLGLDFREDATPVRSSVVGRKIETQHSRNRSPDCSHACLSKTASCTPALTPTPALALKTTPVKPPPIKEVLPTNGERTRVATQDCNSSPLPPLADDPEDNLPPGNFYTSRGFWKQLEASDSLWNRPRDDTAAGTAGVFRSFPFADESSAPPKPQRTFQYRGTGSPMGDWALWENRAVSTTRTRTNLSGPPSCPPPPCPVSQSNGFSRHRKNR